MKPSILKGTRDFGATEIIKREFIFNTIRTVFEKYGFGPLETPSMENLSTLTGKYGEEGDALLFKVLNNGDFLQKADKVALEEKNSAKLVSSISKRGLRYDLTVPFARYVVMNNHALKFPYKRYQIQPVWRADRPQKGRYNEFYQCDVDVIGSKSLIYEAELIQIYDEVFTKLGLQSTTKLNNRKVLYGIAERSGIEDQFMQMTIALDKLDKIGEEKVAEEMRNRNISDEAIDSIFKGIKIKDIEELPAYFDNAATGIKGYHELKEVFNLLEHADLNQGLMFDISLARGLSYYTGCIFEVVSNDVEMGSIGGGGRYDDLTANFGLKDVSGVGVSFGAERIYDVMMTLDNFPKTLEKTIAAIIVSFDDKALTHSFGLVTKLRANGISCDIYPEPAKMKKQMKYAGDRSIPFVIIVGDNEMESGNYVIKNMSTGEQQTKSIEKLISFLKG